MRTVDDILFAIRRLDVILTDDTHHSVFKAHVEAERNDLVGELYEFSSQQLVEFILEFEGF